MDSKIAIRAARAAVKFANEVFSIAEHPHLAPIIKNSGIVAGLSRQISLMQRFVDSFDDQPKSAGDVDPRKADCCSFHRYGGNLDFKCRYASSPDAISAHARRNP